jgi:beta-galactosidase
MPAWLPKVGLQLVLPDSLNRFVWYGRGRMETYPDRKSGAKIGLYSGTVQEQYVQYLVPQDYGNKTDVRWALLENERGQGLLVIPEMPSNVSAQHFTTDNLSRAWYPFQLKGGEGVTLNVDARLTGVGETPINTLEPYRALPGPVRFSVRLRPVDTSKDVPMKLSKQVWPVGSAN